jgi:hypothetical protein
MSVAVSATPASIHGAGWKSLGKPACFRTALALWRDITPPSTTTLRLLTGLYQIW